MYRMHAALLSNELIWKSTQSQMRKKRSKGHGILCGWCGHSSYFVHDAGSSASSHFSCGRASCRSSSFLSGQQNKQLDDRRNHLKLKQKTYGFCWRCSNILGPFLRHFWACRAWTNKNCNVWIQFVNYVRNFHSTSLLKTQLLGGARSGKTNMYWALQDEKTYVIMKK